MDLPVEGQNESVLIFEENMNLFDMKKQIQKIHRQFGHASSEKIKRLIKNARVTDQEFFEITDEVIQGCDFCLKTSCWFIMGNWFQPNSWDGSEGIGAKVVVFAYYRWIHTL